MAQDESSRKKPRIRKTAPTIRELAEASQVEKDSAPAAAGFKRPKIIRWHFPKNKFIVKLASVLGPVGRVLKWLVPKYFINSWRELRQVTWTNRRETLRLTLAVFIFAVVFGALVAGVDKGLDEVFKKLVLK